MIAFIIITIIYLFSVYYAIEFLKYYNRLFNLNTEYIDILSCFIPISNTFMMVLYLIEHPKRKK